MRHDDAKLLQEVQRSTQMGMAAIDTIMDKAENDDFSRQLSRQSLRYAQIHNKALDRILEGEGDVHRTGRVGEFLLRSGIHAGTALNVSRGHLAELVIQNSSRRMTDMWRAIKHNQLAADETVELARELVDFEQDTVEKMREYL